MFSVSETLDNESRSIQINDWVSEKEHRKLHTVYSSSEPNTLVFFLTVSISIPIFKNIETHVFDNNT